MCLGIPMQVIDIEGVFARVKSGGLIRKVNIQMVPLIKPGDYVIIHAGFAIEIIDSSAAEKTLRLINEIR